MRTKWTLLLATAALAAVMGLAGCEGDDGDDGAQGATGDTGPTGPAGPEGPPGQDAFFKPVESCAVCHGATAIADAAAIHVVTGVPTVSEVVAADVEGDLVVSYNLLIDGAEVNDFTTMESNYIFSNGDTEVVNELLGLEESDLNPVSLGEGDYTVTIPGGVALAVEPSRFFLRVSDGMTRAVVLFDFPSQALLSIASDEGCRDCHSEKGVEIHPGFDYPGMVTSQCVTCHKDPVWRGFVEFEDTFVGLIHGIHNSHEFPEGFYAYGEDEFEVTYPSYMTNCSVCHRSDELIEPEGISQLEAAHSMMVSGENCFTCHGSMESWEENFVAANLAFHLEYDETTNCSICHNDVDGVAPATVVGLHNGLITGNDGVIWDGEDTSVTEGAKNNWEITGVADDGTNLTITWQATYDGVGVNPCNATAGPGAPVFFADDGTNGENLSILRNYAQGEDFILATRVDRPQPGGTPGLDNDNTTCDGNVATTVVPVEATDAMYGRVAIQGKPRILNVDPDPDPDFAEEYGSLMPLRAKTPTFDWVIGSLYQHGGNRVDNVDMCILCHNSAANDQYVRAGYGVDASEAYDGQVGEAFEMKTMLHAIHSSGEAQIPFVIYRGRGIYAWAEDESLVPNWPGTGSQPIFGSDDGTGAAVMQNHNFHAPTYPRKLYDCGACHVDGFAGFFPDATKAMATTVETGEDFGNLIDDVLEGASSASCMSCHKQFSAADRAEYNAIGAHAAQNGWEPQAFPEGRQTIIDAN